ncbi:MAG: zinc-binding dehydrogenase [Candidatus Rokubacteria bacterium]|nr:zinc-binding dehydrogenase [Candidatus Rokubacteria bacterium]MBI2554544.1 zinc-binding dehydrogenase [Candidatus Rokubacteria bacterium]
MYPIRGLPITPGFEVAGRIVKVGDAVPEFKADDRVGAMLNAGGYAERAAAPAATLFAEGVRPAGARGIRPDPRRRVGSPAIQLARLFGARVFATASADDKLALARELGADETINYTTQDFTEIVTAKTAGRGQDPSDHQRDVPARRGGQGPRPPLPAADPGESPARPVGPSPHPLPGREREQALTDRGACAGPPPASAAWRASPGRSSAPPSRGRHACDSR